MTYTVADSPVVLNLVDFNGCPYIATLIIDEYPETEDIYEEVTICTGAEYTWQFDGMTYTASDSPVVIDLLDENDCPFTATLIINEYPLTEDIYEEVTICSGDEYTWQFNGLTYTVADSPVVIILLDDNDCEYTATLVINEYPLTEDINDEVSICAGTSYEWPQDGVTYTAADSPVVLTLIDFNGCEYTATLIINEYPLTEDIYEEVTVCEGDSYTWPVTGLTYTAINSPVVVTLLDNNDCEYTATLIINEYPVTPDINEMVVVCSGDSYTWPITGLTYMAINSPVVVTLLDNNDCEYTATLVINEYPVTPDINEEVTVCEGDSYTWPVTGLTYTADDSPVVVILLDDNDCEYTATLIINEEIAPNAGTNGEIELCNNDEIVNLFDSLGGNPDTGGTWVPALSGGYLGTFDPAVDSGGTYIYTVAGQGSCDAASAEVEVNVNEAPYAPTTDDATPEFCSADDATIADLTVNNQIGGLELIWYDASGNILPPITLLVDGGVYYAGYIDLATGCMTDESYLLEVTVTINPTPEDPNGATLQQFCDSDNATLEDLDVTADGGPSGPNTLHYYASLEDYYAGIELPSSTPLYDGMIVIISQSTAEGCESVDLLTVEVEVSPQPEGPLAESPQLFCSEDMPTIADLIVTVTIPGSYLTWYDDILMSNPPLITTEYLIDGMSYFVTQTGPEGCESLPTEIVAEITMTSEAPQGDAVQEFCTLDYPTVADLVATPDITGMVITWYDAAGNMLNDTEALEDGASYYATQTGIEPPYCESIGQFEVVVILSEPTMPIGEVTQEFCRGDLPTVADLIVTFDLGDIVNWYDAPEGGIMYELTDLLEEGMYYAGAVNINGCSSERFAVEVVFDPDSCGIIPDAFSPNGDDLNSVWRIPLLYNYLNFRLEIYDRWGNLVYEYDNNGSMEPDWWNGNSNGRLNFQDGKPVPAGTYFYLIDFNDVSREPETGWVFLNR